MRVQLVAYYTKSYQKEVKRLKESLSKLKLDAYIHPMPDQGSWAQNVMVKPAFILGCLNAFKACDGIFYVDADAEFVSVPDWEKLFGDCHISYHRFQRSKYHAVESLTGSVFVSNTPTAKQFVSEWCDATKDRETSFTPEQDSLSSTMVRWQDRISWKDLPPEYVFIHDDFKMIYPGVKPAILHWQASRRMRK